MATHGNKSCSDQILPKWSDQEYPIPTFDELKKMFLCHFQPRRDRRMKERSHDVRVEESEDKTTITKFIDISIDINEQSRHEHAVGPVEDDDDDGREFGGNVPVGDGDDDDDDENDDDDDDDDDACSPPRSVCSNLFELLRFASCRHG